MAEYYTEVSSDPRAQEILRGFSLKPLSLKNSGTGERAWMSSDWGPEVFTTVKEARLPARILGFPGVGREIVFASEAAIRGFKIVQNVIVHGSVVEIWAYDFGFVIPGSENSWETIVAGDGNMMPAAVLSGNMFVVSRGRCRSSRSRP